MAVIIRHGPNGSYKSASAVWYDLLPALRQGRICITNLEGCYPLEEIEKRLGEKFPDSTRLYRINIIHDDAVQLWRRWFHWAPVGSFILMDEVQDIYPDKSWRESDLDYQPIEMYKDYLPAGLIDDYYAAIDACKPESYDSCDFDDTGSLLFDENGRIVYPKTLNGAFKRHRKFNWDIVCVTPDITDVAPMVRGCAELAKAQSNKDSFFLFKRKPRIYEHNPRSNGVPSANSPVYREKVPLAAFLLYKSTQTGKHTKSGQSKGPFTSPVFYFYALLLVVFASFFVYHSMQADSIAPETADGVAVADTKESSGVSVQGGSRVSDSVGSRSNNKVSGHKPVFVNPYGAKEVYMTGSALDTQGNGVITVALFTKDGSEYHTNNDELLSMGYALKYKRYCQAEMFNIETGQSVIIHCQPTKYEEPKNAAPHSPVILNPFATKEQEGGSKEGAV
ncbi:zonular occludens toxin domain-containing protein [Aeromonas enteropelogenes]|uniref:zonular occludens toxin domain-containing protein n=1 Tax=Aeromonas enteropelogenes TaxID=29489 RepID=UPI003F7462EF